MTFDLRGDDLKPDGLRVRDCEVISPNAVAYAARPENAEQFSPRESIDAAPNC